MQWILESPLLHDFNEVTPWLHGIYHTEVDLDGRLYLVEEIEQFYVREISNGHCVVLVKVRMERKYQEIERPWTSVVELESEIDERRN